MNAATDLSPHPPIHPGIHCIASRCTSPLLPPPLRTHCHPDTGLKQYIRFKMGQLGCEGLLKFKLSFKSDQLMQNWDYNRKPKSIRYQKLRLQISSAPKQAAAIISYYTVNSTTHFSLKLLQFHFHMREVYIFLDLKELDSNSIILSSVHKVSELHHLQNNYVFFWYISILF